MSFRRDVLEKINLFDDRITYGFDDLESVERVLNAGFKVLLNPEVRVFHRHRTKLAEFLSLNFRYGRGGALHLLAKRSKGRLSQWILKYLIGVLSGLGFIFLLFVAALITGLHLLMGIALGLLVSPWPILVGLYARRLKNRRMSKVLIYPIIDILRGLAFTAGALYQFLISAFKGR
ncbi:hypothetical protein DRO56_05270 [Candidatus Bathyarchaeota archaeon]|nr:MAG: hypothetical protein DRO56_05270 [Candidatus Bathyarchaeota archaeon]